MTPNELFLNELKDPEMIKLFKDQMDVYKEFERKRREAAEKDVKDNIGKSFTFKLAVPSGKIVFENDLRRVVDPNEAVDNKFYKSEIDEGLHFSWCMFYTKAYEELKMIHLFVGNTCPGIYKKDNTIVINPDIEQDEETGERNIPKEYKKVGSICTDLWWWSAMDYDHFKSLDTKTPDSNLTIVDMIPGTYNVVATFNEHGHFESRIELE